MMKFWKKSTFSTLLKQNKFVNNNSKTNIIRTYFQIPHAIINRQIPFNKHGLYLVAGMKNEDMKNIKRFTFNKSAFLSLLALLIIPNTHTAFFIFSVIWLGCYSPDKSICFYDNLVTRIYLDKNLRKVVIIIGKNKIVRIIEIKNLILLDQESLKNINLNYGVPIHIINTNYSLTIPFETTIYDRELFSAIFRGYPIKIREEDGNGVKNKFEKLVINH